MKLKAAGVVDTDTVTVIIIMVGIVHLITTLDHQNLLVVMATKAALIKVMVGTTINHTDPFILEVDMAVTIKFNTDPKPSNPVMAVAIIIKCSTDPVKVREQEGTVSNLLTSLNRMEDMVLAIIVDHISAVPMLMD